MTLQAEHKLRVRHPYFDFKDIRAEKSTHYFGGNFIATHVLNALHVIVPLGERFFIRSVKPFISQTKDPVLKEKLKSFIGQESVHEQKHLEFWNVLKEQGYRVERFSELYQKISFELIEPFLNALFGNKIALATTVALEHYTAVLAAEALDPESKTLSYLTEDMRQMLQWHAIEEIEHKSVAFNLLKEVSDSYLLRAGGFVIGTFFLNAYTILGALIFMQDDKEISFKKIISDIPQSLKMGNSVSRRVLTELFEFLKPDFHPDKNDNYYLAENADLNFSK